MSKKSRDNDRLQREGFSQAEIKRLRDSKAKHLNQDVRPQNRRLRFTKWLYTNGKLTED